MFDIVPVLYWVFPKVSANKKINDNGKREKLHNVESVII
jgi:hypothetical protein